VRFVPEEAEDLARKILSLASDVNARFQLAIAGREKLGEYSWISSAEQIGKLLIRP
jgi:hypothetical protein